MKRKVYFMKYYLAIILLIILIYSFISNKTNISNCAGANFKSIKLNAKYILPFEYPSCDQKYGYAFFFPISLINDDEFLLYYSKLNTLNLDSGRITPLIFDPSLVAPWSSLGLSFEKSEPGLFVILSGNRIILPEIVEDNNNEKNNNSIREKVSISAYEYSTGKLIWRTPLEALNGLGLEHRYKLNLTKQGILYTSIDPFLLYCLDSDSGKIKWIYNAEKDFGNLSALYNVPASMAHWRSFQFSVKYYYNDGIITYLSYSKADTTPRIDKYLLISWDGKLISELKYEPIGFLEDSYIFYKEEINKYYIGLAKLIDSSIIWQREVPLPFSSLYPIGNTYFLFNGKEILISQVPCEILTDYCFLLGGRNNKEDFVDCFSIKNGKKMWTYSLLKGSLRAMYPFEDKIFILSSLSDKNGDLHKKVDSITVLSKNNGKILKTCPLNTGTSGEIFYVTQISDNYLLFLRDCVIELSNNSDYVSVASYKELSGTDEFLLAWELVPVVIESDDWLVLSIVPDVRGGLPGGLILSFSKDGNVPETEDFSKDKQKEENNNDSTKNITKDSKKNSNINVTGRKLLSYLLPILILIILLFVLIVIVSFRRKGKYK